ncbi:MAG: sigma 54-interacting transcriptional regulator [Acidobacteria bacterium]|nr:sigma 54-interacting transcriptional regulator [Acidobacteriota bacterium]
MEIRIRVLAGQTEESEFLFRDFPVTIGRRLDNHITIADPSVSRYHCQIVQLGGGLRVVDLGSQNGILVNENPVLQGVLSHGDILSIGGAKLVVEAAQPLELPADAPAGASEPTRINHELNGMETVSLDPTEAIYLRRHPSADATRAERALWLLFQLCRAVGERTSPEDAQVQLIERLFEAIPAERGAVVLADRAGEPPSAVLTRSRETGPTEFEISRAVLAQVLQENRAFLRTRIADQREAMPRTMIADQVESALAVPLIVAGRTIGMLYLDTRKPGAKLDEGHLQLATAAGATAAATIESLRRQDMLRERARVVDEQTREDAEMPLVGESPAVADLRELAKRRALDDRPVLICGPVGSEGIRLAQWIHVNSSRREGPFVRVRCEGRDQGEVCRELFGEGRRADGARALPLLEAAYGGTVVIQGMQSMNDGGNSKLVRLLETGAIERRAGAERIPVNVRLILVWEGPSDHVGLKGSLGDHLSAKLGEALEIPALDDRPGDIPAIALRIAQQAALEAGRGKPLLAPGVIAVLRRSAWPANLTQLRGVIERAEAERTSDSIEIDDLPEEILESGPGRVGGYHQRVFEARRKVLLDALDRTGGNFSEAAELLEINRTYLHRLIRNLEMKDDIARRYS